jgi:hypothetical protein
MTSKPTALPIESDLPTDRLENGAKRYDALKRRRFALLDLEAADGTSARGDFEASLRTSVADAVVSSHPERLHQLWKSLVVDATERYPWMPPQMEARHVSTKPTTDDASRRGTRLLSMVHELHKAGYQRIRISPGISPSGAHWRCPVTFAGNIADDGFSILRFGDDQGLVAPYSSADKGEYFKWKSSSALNSRELAVRFIGEFPRIAESGKGRDWLYAGWLTDVLGRAEQGRTTDLPVLYADWPLEDDPEYLKWRPPPP